ncbi:DNA phosphorothioation-associated putative methyltransferase [Paraburkholderia atlantica]|uniref:DNA phosphorothioation-associated putative methyltransferase n=1 Tax=Paraburkholderia atlantica TaxID=2654982 RepID=UPI001611AECD|nr:DNA phosphorothioation-associated putative methyltransferase [Paraburkholderia atlantica]MBB5509526.1 DNA phosphorothioation-associated putative methyltransferase [Paraburkholderia atlantica]
MSSTTSERFFAASDVEIGKVLPKQSYLHVSLLECVSEGVRRAIEDGIALTGLRAGGDFNVIRLSHAMSDMSLLDYPHFFDEAFPALHRSWYVDLKEKSYRYRNYRSSANPPILHRKELLISLDHPSRARFEQLTLAAEQIGLFDDPTRIGFRQSFESLVEQQGYRVSDHMLVPLANEERACPQAEEGRRGVDRHLTALSRYSFSAPIQLLSRFGFLDGTRSLFDYGCGRGDDVRGLQALGIEATGWDPHYATDQPVITSSIVNLGFVVNVIEDVEERIVALEKSYALATNILVVSAMLANQDSARGTPYRDGVLTSRNTFQKYYLQAELKDFIDKVTGNDAIAVGPGVFFVFKDKEEEQRFRYSRVKSNRRIVPIVARSRPTAENRPGGQRRQGRSTVLYERHRDSLEALWQLCLTLGRAPVPNEVVELRKNLRDLGSISAALRLLKEIKGDGVNELDRAAALRADDVRVYFSSLQFDRRPPYSKLEPQLQIDVKAFFGGYQAALAAGRELLFSLGDVAQIGDACRRAEEEGVGWLEPNISLQLHTALIERLPPILRAYVGCAAVLYGDIASADLLKIHIQSGKLTVMKFDDFPGSPLPRMTQRVKINLRRQELSIFDYGEMYPLPYLYRKSRFLNEESPTYAEQILFEEALEALNEFSFEDYGPSAELFDRTLAARRLSIDGYRLVRSRTIPPLDQKCGSYLTFRDFIECGETQAASNLDNTPTDPESFNALCDLARNVLDPVIDYFGMVELTYGFCSPQLASRIKGRISPGLDQHAAHERNRRGGYICARLGAACDFVVRDEDMAAVVGWMIDNVNFDRLYFYGSDRPIHVSYSTTPARQVVDMIELPGGKRIPKRRHPG